MNSTQHDALMDEAQEMLVKGDSRDTVASHLAETYGWGRDEMNALVNRTANHPITKAIIAANAHTAEFDADMEQAEMDAVEMHMEEGF